MIDLGNWDFINRLTKCSACGSIFAWPKLVNENENKNSILVRISWVLSKSTQEKVLQVSQGTSPAIPLHRLIYLHNFTNVCIWTSAKELGRTYMGRLGHAVAWERKKVSIHGKTYLSNITPLTSGPLYLSPPSTCRNTPWLNQSRRKFTASKSMCVRRFCAIINMIEGDPFLSMFKESRPGGEWLDMLLYPFRYSSSLWGTQRSEQS